MRLVPDWREAWRWISVRVFAALVLLPVVWTALPTETRDLIPASYLPWVMGFVALCGLLGRLKDQNTSA